MSNEFVIQAPTNGLQLNAKRQAEAIFNVFNASGRKLRAQALIHINPPGSDSWFHLETPERDFDIAHSEQFKVLVDVPSDAPQGSYTFSLNMLWEGPGEPEQRTVTGQSVAFEVPKPKPPTPWWIFALAGGSLVVIIAVVVAVVLLNRTVAVPNLDMMTADQAQTALEGAGLKLKEPAGQDYSDTIPLGLVITYSPGQGEKVKPGSEVSVTISQGPADFAIPTGLDGLPEAEARQKLEAACTPQPCFNVTIQQEDSNSTGIGLALRTEPAEGQKLPRGSAVTLVISNGALYKINDKVASLDIFTYPQTFKCNGKLPIWQMPFFQYKTIATPTPTPPKPAVTLSPFLKDWKLLLNFCPNFTSGPDLILTNDVQNDVFYPGLIAIKFNLDELGSSGSLESASLKLYLKSLGKGTTDMDVYISAATSDWSTKGPPKCSTARTYSLKVKAAGTTYTWDLKDLLATNADDVARYGVCVLSTDEDLVTFSSSEGPTGQQPVLTATYRK